jgi:hypothetical protein
MALGLLENLEHSFGYLLCTYLKMRPFFEEGRVGVFVYVLRFSTGVLA